MKRIKEFLVAICFLFVFAVSGIAIKKPMAEAIDLKLSYSDYSAKVESILGKICEFKSRIAGSENERDLAIYIKQHLKTNAPGLQTRNDASTDDGIQSFMYISSFDGLYKN